MEDGVPKHRSSKNTRKWCKGKVGQEHTPECRDYQATKQWMAGQVVLAGWKLLVCTTCGKELATYYPSRWGKSKPPPDWVK